MDIVAAIGNQIKNLSDFEANIITIIQETLLDNETAIVELNTENQLYEQGITSLGVSIADYAPYHEITIAIKQAAGQPTDRVTLRDEGGFHASFTIRINADSFEIIAGDWKAESLAMHYGAEIMGLTPENINELIKSYIAPELHRMLIKYLSR